MATTKVPGMLLPAQPFAKRYVVLVSQATTAAPTEGTVIENTFGTMTIARTSAGLYTWTNTGKFTVGKTIVRVVPMGGAGAAGRAISWVATSVDVVTIHCDDLATPTAADTGNFLLEIYSQ
jgi:hypothetical protein